MALSVPRALAPLVLLGVLDSLVVEVF